MLYAYRTFGKKSDETHDKWERALRPLTPTCCQIMCCESLRQAYLRLATHYQVDLIGVPIIKSNT
jgi:hypothetical protein